MSEALYIPPCFPCAWTRKAVQVGLTSGARLIRRPNRVGLIRPQILWPLYVIVSSYLSSCVAAQAVELHPLFLLSQCILFEWSFSLETASHYSVFEFLGECCRITSSGTGIRASRQRLFLVPEVMFLILLQKTYKEGKNTYESYRSQSPGVCALHTKCLLPGSCLQPHC